MSRPALYLVDASIYIFRAWHSLPDSERDREGLPVNAVQGYFRFLLELLEREKPQHIAVAFDEALESSFRNAIYPPYKANREPAPLELKAQFRHCQALTRALGLATLVDAKFEADDLIGTLLARQRSAGFRGVIVSPDKDLSQLLQADDEQWDYARGLRWGASGVPERMGVRADQVADFLGLAGDAVDNIPGVPGIGAKTAAALLAHFDSLESLLARIDEVPFLRLRGAASHALRLREHGEQARLSRELATVSLAAPLALDVGDAARARGDQAALDALLDRLNFGPMTRRRALAQVGA